MRGSLPSPGSQWARRSRGERSRYKAIGIQKEVILDHSEKELELKTAAEAQNSHSKAEAHSRGTQVLTAAEILRNWVVTRMYS